MQYIKENCWLFNGAVNFIVQFFQYGRLFIKLNKHNIAKKFTFQIFIERENIRLMNCPILFNRGDKILDNILHGLLEHFLFV